MLTGILIGLGFYMVIIPIVDQIVGFVCSSIEYQRMKISLKASKIQKEINDLAGECEVTSYPIGFTVPNEIEEEEDFDE